MSEETTIETQTTETTEVTKPVEQVEPDTQPKPTEDLLERVSKFVEEKDPESKSPDNQASDQFNSAELDVTINGIEDPELKSKMEGLRKSLVSGANNKFQEIATLRKEMQASLERGTPEEWTPERVQKLANDPKFIEAAQSIASNETTDEYSSLSDVEKTNIKEMKDKIDKLEQMNVQSIHNQHQQRRELQHTALESKYANYDRK